MDESSCPWPVNLSLFISCNHTSSTPVVFLGCLSLDRSFLERSRNDEARSKFPSNECIDERWLAGPGGLGGY